jgi:hypothetical protein
MNAHLDDEFDTFRHRPADPLVWWPMACDVVLGSWEVSIVWVHDMRLANGAAVDAAPGRAPTALAIVQAALPVLRARAAEAAGAMLHPNRVAALPDKPRQLGGVWSVGKAVFYGRRTRLQGRMCTCLCVKVY